jgi:flagellar export protein FliJ
MPFRFSLATLLRFRESMEDREYLLLRNAQQEVANIRNHIAQLQDECRAVLAERDVALHSGLMASELQSYDFRRQQLEQAVEQLSAKLKQAEAKRDQQRKTYETAHQKRQVLSTIRDRQAQAYELEEAKRQQRMLDDVFLSRRKPQK